MRFYEDNQVFLPNTQPPKKMTAGNYSDSIQPLIYLSVGFNLALVVSIGSLLKDIVNYGPFTWSRDNLG